MNRPVMPMALPVRMNFGPAIDTRGHPSLYEERPNPTLSQHHGREYASHPARTYDVESQ